MTDNEIIIYGFHLGNSDPDFQRFVRSLSNVDVHNLRKILYEAKQMKYKDGYGAAIYGRDSYGIVNIPESIKRKNWEESDKALFPFIKDLWVASVLGFDDPGMNPVKNHQWRITRIRAVTSYGEGMDAIKSAGLEIGLSYIGAKGIKMSIPKYKLQAFPSTLDGAGILGRDGLTIKKYRFDILYRNSNPRYGTYFSIKEGKSGGNLFRLDYAPHDNVSLLHYHYRWLRKGGVKGSSKPRSLGKNSNP